MTTKSNTIRPFLKWAGGKGQLRPAILRMAPTAFDVYHEPFLGGGAVFFGLLPRQAHLSDINGDLVRAYLQIRNNVEEVIRVLGSLAVSEREFYRIRELRSAEEAERAAHFIFLNKTCFNGLYRVNRSGRFNVPYGRPKSTAFFDPDVLRRASKALKAATLRQADFASVSPVAGDLVYCDPPYTVKHSDNGFRHYNEKIFSWDDQIRLASWVKELEARGVHVMVSNAFHEGLAQLYRPLVPVELTRNSAISGDTKGRGQVKEYLFCSQSLGER